MRKIAAATMLSVFALSAVMLAGCSENESGDGEIIDEGAGESVSVDEVAGSTEADTVGSSTVSAESEEDGDTDSQGTSDDEPIAEITSYDPQDWSTTWDIIQKYGFDDEGYSVLSFDFNEGTVTDEGDYYSAEATMAYGVVIPTTLDVGDTITITTDAVTGETVELTYAGDREFYETELGEGNGLDYYYAETDEDTAVLYCASDDRVETSFMTGTIYINKDAEFGQAILNDIHTIDKSEITGYFNGVTFDENGYATAIIFFGD